MGPPLVQESQENKEKEEEIDLCVESLYPLVAQSSCSLSLSIDLDTFIVLIGMKYKRKGAAAP